VSYAGADLRWAEWIAWILEDAGHSVVIQAWDFAGGSPFVHKMHRAVQDAERTVAVLSAAYLQSAYAEAEWQAAWVEDPSGRASKLLVFRVEDCDRSGLLRQLVTVDLFGLDRDAARDRLLAAVRDDRGKPAGEPTFPGVPAGSAPAGAEPLFPARVPEVWNVPARLAGFTGRRTLLDQVHGQLRVAGRVAVCALHGLGGIGKTQLAIEFAHRYAGDYELVWWINAEQAVQIGGQVAALAARVGVPSTGSVAGDVAAVLDVLRRRRRWLLVFDNAEAAGDIRRWLPAGSGHVLITSRSPVWGAVASRVDVDVMRTGEAVALLERRVPGVVRSTAVSLATEVGCLPLALEQVAGYLEQTGLPPATYLTRFRLRRGAMLAVGEDLVYGGNVDAVWSIALDQLSQHHRAAVTLLELCALCAPEPIPLALFSDNVDLLPGSLADALAGGDPAAELDDLVGVVLGYSLARRHGSSIELHRLVQAVIAYHLDEERRAARCDTLARLLAAALPGATVHPFTWPTWEALGSHLLHAVASLEADDPHDLRSYVGGYCMNKGEIRGDNAAVRTLATDLHRGWISLLGPDHPDTLMMAHIVAGTLFELGEYSAARDLQQDTLARKRRLFGDDHPATLLSAHTLAPMLAACGEVQAAHVLAEDTLKRRRRLFGHDDPDTLFSANTLACRLAALGRDEEARTLAEETLSQLRQLAGDDGPGTLICANTLPPVLVALGEAHAARALAEDTLARCRRVLGDDHPATLSSAHILAAVLADLGEHRAARALAEDTLARRRRVLGDDHPETRSTEQLTAQLPAVRTASARRIPTDPETFM
jgi:hypothetical protein